MSRICLHCGENETDGSLKICSHCRDQAGEFLERNIHLIKAIPQLIYACQLALTEIDQWVEVMGGSDDPRTADAISMIEEALEAAKDCSRQ